MTHTWCALALTVLAPGYVVAQDLPAIRSQPTRPISVEADNVVLRIGARLERQGQPGRLMTFGGNVATTDGRPLEGADVWLIPDGETLVAQGESPRERVQYSGLGRPTPTFFDDVPLSELAHVRTDASGRFEVRGRWHEPTGDLDVLHPGLELPVLVIRADGRATRVDEIAQLRWPQFVTTDSIECGVLPMEPEVQLTGRVVDGTGAPMDDVRVRVQSADCEPLHMRTGWYFLAVPVGGLHEARTDSDGRFRLAGLFPGGVSIELHRADRGSLLLEPVPLGPDAANALPDTVLPAGRVVSGHVVDTAGRPVPGVLVHAVDRERSLFGFGCVVQEFQPGDDRWPTELSRQDDADTVSARADGVGAFWLIGSWTRALTLYAEAPGFSPACARDVLPGSTDVRLELPPGASFRVSLIDSTTGSPVASARLEAYRVGTLAGRHAEGPDDTTFALPVAVGRVGGSTTWRIDGAGPVGTMLYVAAPGFAPVRHDLRGLDPGEHEEVTLELARALTLGGVVLDDVGEPVAGAHVDLTVPGQRYTGFVIGTVTDGSGGFEFSALNAGTWDVVVKAPDWVEAIVENVSVSPASPASPLAVHLERGGTVRGTIDQGVDGPKPYHDILLDDAPFGRTAFGTFGRFGGPYTRPDPQGRFEFRGVRPGSYRLSAVKDAYVEFTIAAGQTIEVSLDTHEVK